MEETDQADRRDIMKSESTKELTAAERAERILRMCSIVEQSRERIKHAEKTADDRTPKDGPKPLPKSNLQDDDEETKCSECEHNSMNCREKQKFEDDSDSVSQKTVTNLTTDELKEKLRQCQMSLLKVSENAKLKYIRLQTEHSRLKESVITIQSEADHFKKQTHRFMKERDEAKRNLGLAKETSDTVMKKIINENESLRKRVEALKKLNQNLLQQREVLRCKLDGCTCQDTELHDFSQDARRERVAQRVTKTNTGIHLWPLRRGKDRAHQTHSTLEPCNIDIGKLRSSSDRIIRYDDDGTHTTFSNTSPLTSRTGSSVSSQNSGGHRFGVLSNIWRSTRLKLSEEASVTSKSSRSIYRSEG